MNFATIVVSERVPTGVTLRRGTSACGRPVLANCLQPERQKWEADERQPPTSDLASAAEAVVRRVLRDRAVGSCQRLVLDVKTAALHGDADASHEYVLRDVAVLENERSTRRAVRPEGEGSVVDAAAECVTTRPGDGG